MSQEVMLANIKAGLDHVDAAALQSIWTIINQSKPEFATIADRPQFQHLVALKTPPKFAGKNLTLDEYERLSIKEKGELQRGLKEKNHLWLQEKFSTLKAAWLVVIDSEVFNWGKTLKNLPLAKQNVEIYHQTGKFPFIFINDDFMLIEESMSTWHATKDSGDFYPTLPVTLSSASGVVELVGDFDTGASGTFVDFDFLQDHNLFQPEPGDYYELARHLNQLYRGVPKSLRFQLTSKTGEPFAFETLIYCVPDWRLSPFVKINPNRVALIGRDLLLALKPKVVLDFAQCLTEIAGSTVMAQATKKKSVRKKQTPTPRRRR